MSGRDGLRDVLNEAARTWAHGNVDALARMLRLHPETLRQWCQGSAPQLDSVLELACRLGVTPRQLLTGDRNAVHERLATYTARDAEGYDRLKPPQVKFDTVRVRSVLEGTLASDEDPPPSLREVARRLGIVEVGGLYRRFPELSRAVSARFQAARKNRTLARQDALREEVRQVVAALHAAGQYPSCNVVRARLSHPAAFRNPVVRDAWETSLRAHGWEKGTQGCVHQGSIGLQV